MRPYAPPPSDLSIVRLPLPPRIPRELAADVEVIAARERQTVRPPTPH